MSSRTTARPPAAWLICALCVACGACAEPAARTAAGAGEWTGDLQAPELPVAIGLLAQVEPEGSVVLTALGAMGFEGGEMTGVRFAGDSLWFDWPSEGRTCALAQDSVGGYAGLCETPADTPWRLRLVPPARRREPVGYAASLLARPDWTWRTREERWGRLHVAAADSMSPSARSVSIGNALRRGLEILGAGEYDRPVDVFLVAGRAQVESLTALKVASIADPLGSTVVVAGLGGLETVNRHELMHVLSINIWGVPAEPAAWIREGIATYAGGTCAGYTLHALASSLWAEERALPLRGLLDEFYSESDLITYLESGSLFQYLYEEWGLEAAKLAWQRGLEDMLDQAGVTLEELEAQWREYLRRPEHSGTVDWTRLKQGCG